jgi:hypothetical protein
MTDNETFTLECPGCGETKEVRVSSMPTALSVILATLSPGEADDVQGWLDGDSHALDDMIAFMQAIK